MANFEKCLVNGCDKSKRRNGPKSVYCNMHYRRFRLYGEPGEAEMRKVYIYDDSEICSVLNCEDKAEKKDMCSYHYDFKKRTSYPLHKVDEMKKRGCFVCGSMENLRLDHDHSCCSRGKSCENCVRGILCHKCNSAAGLLEDDVARMMKLAEYIMHSRDVIKIA